MTVDTRQLDTWATGLLNSLGPNGRRRLARQLAMELRRRNQDRIAAQTNPDGTPFEPRKPQFRRKTGRIKRKMFSKLRTTRYLKTECTPNGVVIAFIGKVQRIAQVHHYGLRDRVQKNGPKVQYQSRELLGISNADFEAVTDLVLKHASQ